MERLDIPLQPSYLILTIAFLLHPLVLLLFCLSTPWPVAVGVFVVISGHAVWVFTRWQKIGRVQNIILMGQESALIVNGQHQAALKIDALWLLSFIVVLKIETDSQSCVIPVVFDSTDQESFRQLRRAMRLAGHEAEA